MREEPGPEKREKKRSILDTIFPREYDFEALLVEQARNTEKGVRLLVNWLREHPESEPEDLVQLEAEVDVMRHRMEDSLVDAFSTPFDRQDIYSLSRSMDYILNFSTETALEMHAFGIAPDAAILEMAETLREGTHSFSEGVENINSDSAAVETIIKEARDAMHRLDRRYIQAMTDLFGTNDPMQALKKREIYHHLRDAGRALRDTVDILHRTTVGLS